MHDHPLDSAGLDNGALALLQQGYRNNWQQYLAALEGSGGARGWDVCVLTASNRRQAQAYEAQLEARRSGGLLPAGTRFLVLPDPDGLRIGSGGATLRVLARLAADGGAQALATQRVLVIHSGGDSRRLPHCSAVGKLFSRVPHELPDGRASSLFDEFLVSLSGLPGQVPPGVLVASGDVLILFDHLQLAFQRPGIIGVAAAAPADDGTRHGVYVSEGGSQRVRAFLHKPPLARLHAEGAVDAAGHVQIDTGLVWLDPAAAERLLTLQDGAGEALLRGVTLNLYGDLVAPLAAATEREAYLADTSDGPATAALREVRERAWDLLRGTPFSVERLHPAAFVHFGSTREYLQVLAESLHTLGGCGWQARAASWLPARSAANGNGLVLANAYVGALPEQAAPGSTITDATLLGPVRLGAGSLIANVMAGEDGLTVGDEVVVHQLPLLDGAGWVTRVYGAADDPKVPLHSGGTLLNMPWEEWLRRAGLRPGDLWPATSDAALCTLWEARLYPVCEDREESLRASAWLERPERAAPEEVARWRQAERLSLSESYLRADVRRIVREAGEIEDRVRARRFAAQAEAERPAGEYTDLLGGRRDAPPYSLERGGTVLNGAVRLRGALPIVAEAEVLAEPEILLESRDIEATIRPRTVGDVLDFANPADPFALLKAALVFRGMVPRLVDPNTPLADLLGPLGRGLRLSTATTIPRGSGLGTSSILAGAVLQALATLLGTPVEEARLFDEVLCLEQMITTGGGWQDQIGGLTGGVKLIRTRPGLPQAAQIERLPMTPTLAEALNERLLLVYTGQRRLAKNLLRAVMGRWMTRDPEMVAMLADIAALAVEMQRALLAVDLDAFGALIGAHWQINKRMDAGCSNPFIDDLLALCAPYMVGAKLAGAGGGGYALVIAKDGGAARDLGEMLARRFGGGDAGLWGCTITSPGLVGEEAGA